MKIIQLLGVVLFFLGLYLALFIHSTIWYSFFIVGTFLNLEIINSKNGFSVLKRIKKLFLIWAVFLLFGIIIEVVGNSLLNLWDYPAYGKLEFFIHVVIIGYPFVFLAGLAFFVFIQNLFSLKKLQIIIFPLAAFLFGYLNEYPNLFAYEWKYTNWPLGEFLGIPILVSILWIGLLVVLPFRRLFLNNQQNNQHP